MITHVRHTGIVVADLERALSFWCDALGFRVTKRMEESGPYLDAMLGLKHARATTVKLAAPDGNLVELLHFHSHPDKPAWQGTPFSTGLTHIAFTVDDIEATCERLRAAGAQFFAAPQASPDGTVKVTYGSGPEGMLFELVEVRKK
jgi:catechol 2,3-dioxygenase-like lactoylglutathione lyase family enzyme